MSLIPQGAYVASHPSEEHEEEGGRMGERKVKETERGKENKERKGEKQENSSNQRERKILSSEQDTFRNLSID